jgi:hypothetical protein
MQAHTRKVALVHVLLWGRPQSSTNPLQPRLLRSHSVAK